MVKRKIIEFKKNFDNGFFIYGVDFYYWKKKKYLRKT